MPDQTSPYQANPRMLANPIPKAEVDLPKVSPEAITPTQVAPQPEVDLPKVSPEAITQVNRAPSSEGLSPEQQAAQDAAMSFIQGEMASMGIKPPREFTLIGSKYREHPEKGWQIEAPVPGWEAAKKGLKEWRSLNEDDKADLQKSYDIIASSPVELASLGLNLLPGAGAFSGAGSFATGIAKSLGMGALAGGLTTQYHAVADKLYGPEKAQMIRDAGGVGTPNAVTSALLAGTFQGVGEGFSGFFGARARAAKAEIEHLAQMKGFTDKAQELKQLAETNGVNLTPTQLLADTPLGPYAAAHERDMAKDTMDLIQRQTKSLEAMQEIDGALTRLKVLQGPVSKTEQSITKKTAGIARDTNFVDEIMRDKAAEMRSNAALIDEQFKRAEMARPTAKGGFEKPTVNRSALKAQIVNQLADQFGPDLLTKDGVFNFSELENRIAKMGSGKKQAQDLLKFMRDYFPESGPVMGGEASTLVPYSRKVVPEETSAPIYPRSQKYEQGGLPLVEKSSMVTVGDKEYTKEHLISMVEAAERRGSSTVTLSGSKTPISDIRRVLSNEGSKAYSESGVIFPKVESASTMGELAQHPSYQQLALEEREMRNSLLTDERLRNLTDEQKSDLLSAWRSGKLATFTNAPGEVSKGMSVSEFAKMVQDVQELASNAGAFGAGTVGGTTENRLAGVFGKIAHDLRETHETFVANGFERLGMKDKAARIIKSKHDYSRLISASGKLSSLVDKNINDLGELISATNVDEFGTLVKHMNTNQKRELSGIVLDKIRDDIASRSSSGAIERVNAAELYQKLIGKVGAGGLKLSSGGTNLKTLLGEESFNSLEEILRVGTNIQKAAEYISNPQLIKQAVSMQQKALSKLSSKIDSSGISRLVFDMFKKDGDREFNQMMQDALDMVEMAHINKSSQAESTKKAMSGLSKASPFLGGLSGRAADRTINRPTK